MLFGSGKFLSLLDIFLPSSANTSPVKDDIAEKGTAWMSGARGQSVCRTSHGSDRAPRQRSQPGNGPSQKYRHFQWVAVGDAPRPLRIALSAALTGRPAYSGTTEVNSPLSLNGNGGRRGGEMEPAALAAS